MKRLILLCLVFGGCHAVSVPSVKQPDGSWHLQCGNSINLCITRANDLCDNRGYVVLGGVNKRELYGAELGQSQVEVREAELTVACADRRGQLPKVLTTNSTIPPAPPAPVAAQKSAAPACTPGATQRCVGAAACTGGQACLPDGSAFGPCDCGAAHSTP